MSTAPVAAPGRTPRQTIERAVVETLTTNMVGTVVCLAPKALAQRIVDRITSAEYAGALRDTLDRKPHAWNPGVAKRQ